MVQISPYQQSINQQTKQVYIHFKLRIPLETTRLKTLHSLERVRRASLIESPYNNTSHIGFNYIHIEACATASVHDH